MLNLRRSLLFAASLLAVGITLTVSNVTTTLHADDDSDKNIEGTWSVMVTPNGGTPFRALISFSSGGTAIESSAGGNSDKGGQGVWKRTGPRTFLFTIEQFQYDAAGTFVGTLKVRESAVFDQSFTSYSGVGEIEVRDAAGNVAFTTCARTHAARMQVETPSCR
jgi:hypothetical protein